MKNTHIKILIFLLVASGTLKAEPVKRAPFLPLQAQADMKNDGEQKNKVSGFLQDQNVTLNTELRTMIANVNAYIAKEKLNDKYREILRSYKDLIQEIYTQFNKIMDEIYDEF